MDARDEAFERCPCGDECPDGCPCVGCPKCWDCEICRDLEHNENTIFCMKLADENYLECLNGCTNSIECYQCTQQREHDIENCPCMSMCPSKILRFAANI